MASGITTTRQAEIPWQELDTIVPAESIRAAGPNDAIDGTMPVKVVTPGNELQISELLKWATGSGARVSVRGGGTKLGWGNLPGAVDLIVSTEKLAGLVEHAWQDMTVTVRAGTKIAVLQQQLREHGQRLALDALWPDRATVGGVIATHDSCPLRLRFGSIRDLILGITVVLPNGTIARSGGKVVKNVAGYDLPKLLTGSLGTLAVITEATFRAHPLPAEIRTLSFELDDLQAASKFMLAIANSTLVPTGLQLRLDSDQRPRVDVRFEGIREGVEAQSEAAQKTAGTAAISDVQSCWQGRESLWSGGSLSSVGRFSVLPADLTKAIGAIRDQLPSARIIAQSTGLGLFSAECESLDQMESAIERLRQDVQQLKGTLVLLSVPLELKKKLDVFGQPGDGYPLMVRVKQQFDSHGILNPGRFLGGI